MPINVQKNSAANSNGNATANVNGRGESLPTQGYTRKPDWLKVQLNTTHKFRDLKRVVKEGELNTVCEEARCPNIHECWGSHKTATFMLLGDTCTRRCRFCAVKTGLPGAVDWGEPERVASAVAELELEHVVITMVNRDDLKDGGASLVAKTVRAIRRASPRCGIELLTSDFLADPASIATVLEAHPDVMSHNVETVRRLTPQVRSRSYYDRSLRTLGLFKELAPSIVTKSSMMLGLGERREEILQVMEDIRAQGVSMMNLGQYLQPSRNHAAVQKYWTPSEFAELRERALEMGFDHVEAGPLVRSSYHAGEQYAKVQEGQARREASGAVHGSAQAHRADTAVLDRVREYQSAGAE